MIPEHMKKNMAFWAAARAEQVEELKNRAAAAEVGTLVPNGKTTPNSKSKKPTPKTRTKTKQTQKKLGRLNNLRTAATEPFLILHVTAMTTNHWRNAAAAAAAAAVGRRITTVMTTNNALRAAPAAGRRMTTVMTTNY